MEQKDIVAMVVPFITATAAIFGFTVLPDEIYILVSSVVAIITVTLTVWYRNSEKDAKLEAEDNLMAFYTASEREHALISPEHATSAIVDMIPTRGWKMTDDTKQFLCSGAFRPFCGVILAQVAAHEANNEVKYTIDTGLNGITYEIEYGLLRKQVGNT